MGKLGGLVQYRLGIEPLGPDGSAFGKEHRKMKHTNYRPYCAVASRFLWVFAVPTALTMNLEVIS